MPTYPFRCRECGEKEEIFEHHFRDLEQPSCPSCGAEMKRVYTSFSTGSSSPDSSSDSLPGSMNRKDPREMVNDVSNSYKAMGQDPGKEFNEAVDRINKGENPDKVQDFVKDAKAEKKENSGD